MIAGDGLAVKPLSLGVNQDHEVWIADHPSAIYLSSARLVNSASMKKQLYKNIIRNPA